VIDLSGMREVRVDPLNHCASVEGGATIGDLVRACRPHELLPVTGTVRTVGMAGLTLAGGYGPLAGKWGLALDNLLGAEVVLPDGRRVEADSSTNPELFWALRGGGGNFGVVTRLIYRLHPIDPVVAGLAIFKMRDARTVLAGYRELLARAPDELTLQIGVMATPAGPALFLFPTWSGETAAGEKLLASLASFGTPLRFEIGPTAYEDLLAKLDVFGGRGRCWELRTRSLASLTPDAEAVLLDSGYGLTSQFSAISVHHFHGAATRVPVEDTAFGNRQNHLMVELIAGWEPTDDDDGSRHRSWADRAAEALDPFSLPGGYPNLLGPEENARAMQSYGANARRLLALKRRFDPENVFASAIPALTPAW
jgi:FAD/FMN-containing dehydrogenase